MGKTSIEWTDHSWPIVNGCRRISPGCGGASGVGGCYAERLVSTRLSKTKKYGGLAVFKEARGPQWTGEARLWEPDLEMPLRLKEPSKIFVADMGDLFFEGVSDEVIDRVMAVMLLAPQHTFQVLTKRADRMREYLTSPRLYERIIAAANRVRDGRPELTQVAISNPAEFPARWIWFGVSVESQKYADERIPELLATPAAVRFVSYEPAIGPVDFFAFVKTDLRDRSLAALNSPPMPGLDWIIVGGESGPGARTFDVAWAREVVRQTRGTRTACFVKQLGSFPKEHDDAGRVGFFRPGPRVAREHGGAYYIPTSGVLKHPKGGDWDEWPEDLRVREWPEVRA